jgi:sulfoxide reductase heme-binding subunit YedZ
VDPLRRRRLLQGTALLVGFAPFAGLCIAAASDRLGANPIEEITHTTGDFALRWLLVALAVTPLRRQLRLRWIAPLRRTFGLLAFFYACCHFLTWFALDQFFDWQAIVEDVQERRYVLAGLTAFTCMIPLAATSTRAMTRRLGRHWKTIHRLVFAAAVAAIVHYLWLVKADLLPALVHAAFLAILLGHRVWWQLSTRSARLRAEPAVR